MGTVPISVIMGFDYPLDPYQVEMVGDAFDFMKKKKGDNSEKQTRYTYKADEWTWVSFVPSKASNDWQCNGLQW